MGGGDVVALRAGVTWLYDVVLRELSPESDAEAAFVDTMCRACSGLETHPHGAERELFKSAEGQAIQALLASGQWYTHAARVIYYDLPEAVEAACAAAEQAEEDEAAPTALLDSLMTWLIAHQGVRVPAAGTIPDLVDALRGRGERFDAGAHCAALEGLMRAYCLTFLDVDEILQHIAEFAPSAAVAAEDDNDDGVSPVEATLPSCSPASSATCPARRRVSASPLPVPGLELPPSPHRVAAPMTAAHLQDEQIARDLAGALLKWMCAATSLFAERPVAGGAGADLYAALGDGRLLSLVFYKYETAFCSLHALRLGPCLSRAERVQNWEQVLSACARSKVKPLFSAAAVVDHGASGALRYAVLWTVQMAFVALRRCCEGVLAAPAAEDAPPATPRGALPGGSWFGSPGTADGCLSAYGVRSSIHSAPCTTPLPQASPGATVRFLDVSRAEHTAPLGMQLAPDPYAPPLVEAVAAGTPAAAAGIAPGMLVVAVDGAVVRTGLDLAKQVLGKCTFSLACEPPAAAAETCTTPPPPGPAGGLPVPRTVAPGDSVSFVRLSMQLAAAGDNGVPPIPPTRVAESVSFVRLGEDGDGSISPVECSIEGSSSPDLVGLRAVAQQLVLAGDASSAGTPPSSLFDDDEVAYLRDIGIDLYAHSPPPVAHLGCGAAADEYEEVEEPTPSLPTPPTEGSDATPWHYRQVGGAASPSPCPPCPHAHYDALWTGGSGTPAAAVATPAPTPRALYSSPAVESMFDVTTTPGSTCLSTEAGGDGEAEEEAIIEEALRAVEAPPGGTPAAGVVKQRSVGFVPAVQDARRRDLLQRRREQLLEELHMLDAMEETMEARAGGGGLALAPPAAAAHHAALADCRSFMTSPAHRASGKLAQRRNTQKLLKGMVHVEGPDGEDGTPVLQRHNRLCARWAHLQQAAAGAWRAHLTHGADSGVSNATPSPVPMPGLSPHVAVPEGQRTPWSFRSTPSPVGGAHGGYSGQNVGRLDLLKGRQRSKHAAGQGKPLPVPSAKVSALKDEVAARRRSAQPPSLKPPRTLCPLPGVPQNRRDARPQGASPQAVMPP